MCKNCSDISWHRLNLNQSKTNCPKNLNYDGLIVREMGPWPECIFRSLLQFLVTLSGVPRKLYGSLTASLRQTCYSCKNREVAVQSPPGLLVVTLQFLISRIVRSSCGHRNICDHNYRRSQDLTIFKNHVLQTVDHRTVRWPYGGSMICDRGISQ